MTAPFALPSQVARTIDSPPFCVQFAIDGNWMEANRFSPDDMPNSDAVRDILHERETDVAVEFCFKMNTGENFFLGLRRSGERGDRDAVAFVVETMLCGANERWSDIGEFLLRLEQVTTGRLGVDEGNLCTDLDNVEIGITDWWRRGDVVEVFRSGQLLAPTERELTDELAGFPGLHVNDINFVCLEFNFRSPLHHWFGVEISEPVGPLHHLNIEGAARWLDALLPEVLPIDEFPKM